METQVNTDVVDGGKSLTANQQMISCAKTVMNGFAWVVGCIVVFGALDLYGSMSWEYLKNVVSLGGASLWLPCCIGLSVSAVGCWSLCSIANSVQSWKLIAVAVLSCFVWLVCFAAANSFVFNDDYPELEGFIWWAYLALYLPIVAIIIFVFSLAEELQGS